MKSSKIILTLGLLVMTGTVTLQAATVQTTKGERISSTLPQPPFATATASPHMTVANCPLTRTETGKITYSRYSKDHDQVTRTGVVQRMKPCHQELTRKPDKQTVNQMVGCK